LEHLSQETGSTESDMGGQLQVELEEKQAIQDLDWLRRSEFVDVDDTATASKL
jgi:hypothetical protein